MKVRMWRGMGKSGEYEDSSEESDDLDESTAALLSMLPNASIVVDRQNEVVRSSPQAYMLGVVANDEIIQPRVLEAIDHVRESGGKTKLDLETQTPQEFLGVAEDLVDSAVPSEEERKGSLAHAHASSNAVKADELQATSRPNWLKITVGRINRDFVVVLLADVSEAIRFAQTRDSFIENVSEQLLQPTSALSQLSLDLEHANGSSPEVRKDAELVRRHCSHLEHMVADLMLLMKAQEPIVASDNNRINLLQLARKVAEQLRSKADAEDIALHVGGDADVTVNGDSQQIKAALVKLVENALGYSSSGSSVNIAVSQSKDGEHALLRVLDQGIGIPKDEQRQVFERFYRGTHQTDATHEGIGLGLAIVKHVALTHHGSATVWSSQGHGSTFSMVFPLAPQHMEQ
ncbi:sensor histidine kinase [Bifidobacterium aquikefiricola]|uniref:Sensor-like histidine kinase SenX3 n=1 Tax=Bifidobacterium aquikefiricola TaxID=3059038 RepID=A0AB39U8B6_9BIFI